MKAPFLFFMLLILPIALFATLSHVGIRHPLESKSLNDVYFLEGSTNNVEILFFGYAGCSFICPSSLTKAGKVLDEFKKANENLSVGGIFIDINAEAQLQRAESYGTFFSPNFTGYNTDQEELESIKQTFKINITQAPDNQTELFHTDHFFLLKKGENGWVIHRVLANTVSPEVIETEILNAFKLLN